MNRCKLLNQKRARRTARVRARIFGTAARPRLAIFRSNKNISAQLINDENGHTLVHASSRELAKKIGKKSDEARMVGELIAQKAREKGISRAICDKRHYQYHGRVKAFVEGARSAGLKI